MNFYDIITWLGNWVLPVESLILVYKEFLTHRHVPIFSLVMLLVMIEKLFVVITAGSVLHGSHGSTIYFSLLFHMYFPLLCVNDHCLTLLVFGTCDVS